MPSGFQQDSNQLSPSYYRVRINMGWFDPANTSWNAYGDAPLEATGRINPYNWDNYTTLPSSPDNGIALANGNLRWQNILNELGRFSDMQILDLEVYSDHKNDANYDIQGIAFTVKYDRDEFLFPAYCKVMEHDNTGTDVSTTIDGVTYPIYYSYSGAEYDIATTADVVKDLVLRGIMYGSGYRSYSEEYRKFARVWNSDKVEEFESYIMIYAPGSAGIGDAQNIFNDILVSELDGTPLTMVKSD